MYKRVSPNIQDGFTLETDWNEVCFRLFSLFFQTKVSCKMFKTIQESISVIQSEKKIHVRFVLLVYKVLI